MMSLRKVFAAFLLLCLFSSLAYADAPALRGFVKGEGYQYVTFGTYPTTKEGEETPVLWRVLGPGTPEDDDLNNAANDLGFKGKKYATGDNLTGENEDVFCLLTEYIIDFTLYHDVADEADGPALDYKDTLLYTYLNETLLPRLLTAEEQSVLVEMPQRGLISVPTRKGELFRPDYGFKTEDWGETPRRATEGTPYAYSLGLKLIKGHSWYWTTDWRAPGRRWIVGDNGHCSVSGLVREGGVRPLCYVHTDRLTILGGDGTMDSPYQLAVVSDETK